MHLMFLSNDSLQDPFHAGAYRLVIISVAAMHMRLVIFPKRPLFHQKLSCSKQRSKKHAVRKQKDIRREGSNKNRKQISSLSTKITNLGDPQNIIPSKIPCLTVSHNIILFYILPVKHVLVDSCIVFTC